MLGVLSTVTPSAAAGARARLSDVHGDVWSELGRIGRGRGWGDAFAHCIHLSLERRVRFQSAAKEATPKPCAKNHSEPTVGLVPLLQHQRNHDLLLLVRVVGLQNATTSSIQRASA